MHVLTQFLLHPGLNTRAIPDTALGGVCSNGPSQHVAQQGGRTAVVVPLILQARQSTFVVRVDDLVRALVGIAGERECLLVALPFSQESEKLTPSSLDGAGTAAVDAPEILGSVLEIDLSDALSITV